MKRIYNLIFTLFALTATPAMAALSPECSTFIDCDTVVACELVLEVERAASGQVADYDGAVVRAIKWHGTCAGYDDNFNKNLDIPALENPPIRISVNWDNVRMRVKSGDAGTFTAEDSQMVKDIVTVMRPDDKAQEQFFTALATTYVTMNKRDGSARLDDAFVLDYLGTDDNLNKYRGALITLTGETVNADLGIDVNWDDVLIEVSQVLDSTIQMRGAMVCENNRSLQWTLDAVTWAATAVAAIFTVYAGGAGGAAVAAGRAAVGAGLKTAAKAAAKVGGKVASKAARSMARAGRNQIVKAAIKLTPGITTRAALNASAGGLVKTGAKTFVKTAGANLVKKWGILTGLGLAGAIWQFGSHTGGWGTAYSLVNSNETTDFINCQDLDHNEGCYTICGEGRGTDLLNTAALVPVMGDAYCVDSADYSLHKINRDGSRGERLVMDKTQWTNVRTRIQKNVADKGKCDWNEDDIDMYVGAYVYDPDTLEINTDAIIVDDVIRIDD